MKLNIKIALVAFLTIAMIDFRQVAISKSNQDKELIEAVSLQIKSSPDNQIRRAKLVQEDGSIKISGSVSRGNKSHVPKFFLGHIDVTVFSVDQEILHQDVIDLGGRQVFFFYQLPDDLSKNTTVQLEYHKMSHLSH